MEHSFWHNKWEVNQIGFHLNYIQPLLKRNLERFTVNHSIFIPLCGKTLDIGYLLDQGHSIVAVELSEKAVIELFEQLDLIPEVSSWNAREKDTEGNQRQIGKIYQAEKLTIYVGDFFALQQQDLGVIGLVYDRAALIALPAEMRVKYAKHMIDITQHARQLLITLDYDQSVAGGPPFAVSPQEVENHYRENYAIQLLEEADIIDEEPRFKAKGLTSFYQRCYQLV